VRITALAFTSSWTRASVMTIAGTAYSAEAFIGCC